MRMAHSSHPCQGGAEGTSNWLAHRRVIPTFSGKRPCLESPKRPSRPSLSSRLARSHAARRRKCWRIWRACRNQWGGNPKRLGGPVQLYDLRGCVPDGKRDRVPEHGEHVCPKKARARTPTTSRNTARRRWNFPIAQAIWPRCTWIVGDGIIADAPKAADGTAELKERIGSWTDVCEGVPAGAADLARHDFLR